MNKETNYEITPADLENMGLQSADITKSLEIINNRYLSNPIANIPVAEIASLGAIVMPFLGQAEGGVVANGGEGLYRCVFPDGVAGKLFATNDGTGFLGGIAKDGGGLAQARWVPVEETAVAPIDPQTILIAIAVLVIAKQIHDLKKGQKEIIEFLERESRSQLLADHEILIDYVEKYQYYWDKPSELAANLIQVKDIKRNAGKSLKAYKEQLNGYLDTKLLGDKLSARNKIGNILDKFIHFKLAVNVYSLSSFMEIMLAKNYAAGLLYDVSGELHELEFEYKTLYTECYNRVESLKSKSIQSDVLGGAAKLTKTVGETIGKIPLIKEGLVDEALIAASGTIEDADQKSLQQTLELFMENKMSGTLAFADQIDVINIVANKPIAVDIKDKVISISEYKEVV